jgi:glycerophosphoryl diester phosphodiesterase
MLTHLPKPTIFAHRGASRHAPENTLAAFEVAVQQGADGIELDAKLTADGQVVVIHDQSLERTTATAGKVKEMTLSQIKALDAGSHFDCAFRGEPIPTLEEVLVNFGRLTYINIELTNYTSILDDLPEKVAGLVKKYGLEKRVLFSSFNPLALIRVRRQLPQCPMGLLAFPGKMGILARSRLGWLLSYQALHPELGDATPSLVEKTHRRGARVHVYTVNQVQDMRRLFDLKVDGIFTDDPVTALQARSLARER